MLIIDRVKKTYNKKTYALDEVSLTLHPGDLYGFVGHNGAGKTTLLKAIAGIHTFDGGHITLHNIAIEKNPIEFKKKLAYLSDQPDLYESLSGRQFIDFIADIYQVPFKDRQSRIEQYASLFEMKEALQQPIYTYSHGMKQKTALMAAFVHDPELYLLDEPFVGLDPKASFVLKQLFVQFREQKKIIFFSSHVLEVVEKLTNRIAIISKGQLVAEGKTQDILADKNLEAVFLKLT